MIRHLHIATKALVLAIILSTSGINPQLKPALPGKCSLAAYSETRSFRDALDGRSMEEAISGPVDKDTSSYGDRTPSSAGGSGSSGSMQSAGAGQMMLNIPANGNLMPTQQQQQTADESGSKGAGSEIEREAGPINGMPMDTEQQLMEQKNQRQMRTPNGRLMVQKNARQQQQMQQDYGSKSASGASGTESTGFEEQAGGKGSPAGKGDESGQSYSQGGKQGDMGQKGMDGAGGSYGNAASQSPDDEQQQQQHPQTMNGNGSEQPQQQEKGYGNGAQSGGDQQMSAKQKAMAAKLMNMNNGMKYSRSAPQTPAMSPAMMMMLMMNGNGDGNGNGGSQYGDKKMSSMAQNMMMSLANKAAYMGRQQQQQQQYQRQMAPPVMMSNGNSGYSGASTMAMNGGSYMKASNGGGSYGGSVTGGMPSSGMMSNMVNAMLMSAGNGNGMRAMRRANQRKMERKMSPAMVNAMLNKMLSNKQQESEPNGYGTMKPSSIATMMKSPGGAEMLANAMMPQITAPGGAMSGMSGSEREKYKRMMMAAIMQQSGMSQQQEQSSDSEQQQEQQKSDSSYGGANYDRAQGDTKSGNGASMGYSGMSTMAPSMGIKMMNGVANKYYKQEQEQEQQPMQMVAGNDYARQKKMSKAGTKGASQASGYGEGQEQEQQQQTDAGYNSNDQQQQQQQQMMNGSPKGGMYNSRAAPGLGTMMMKQRAGVNQGYGSSSSSMYQNMMAMNGGRMSGSNKYGGNGDSDEDQKRKKKMLMAAMMIGGANYDSGTSDMDEQQREAMPTMGASGTKSSGGSDSYSQMQSPAMSKMNGGGSRNGQGSPMNGFRQAYNQQQGQQQAKGASNYPAMNEGEGATKGGDSAPGVYSPSSTLMPRPASASKGAGQEAYNEQETDTQQQQTDEDGSAPMGQAEPFAFDYKIEDDYGNGQYRKEQSDKNGVVRGSYGYTDTKGIYRHVEYVADENGFRANIKSNEPGLSDETMPTQGAGDPATSPMGTNGNTQQQQQQQMDSPDMSPVQQQQQMYQAQSQMNDNGEKK